MEMNKLVARIPMNAVLTYWLKEIAPSPKVRWWFGPDPERCREFERRYRAELARNNGGASNWNRIFAWRDAEEGERYSAKTQQVEGT